MSKQSIDHDWESSFTTVHGASICISYSFVKLFIQQKNIPLQYVLVVISLKPPSFTYISAFIKPTFIILLTYLKHHLTLDIPD